MGEKECVFCAGPLIYANLGLNCCRACAVFYKWVYYVYCRSFVYIFSRRAVASRSQLFCLGGANDCSQNSEYFPPFDIDNTFWRSEDCLSTMSTQENWRSSEDCWGRLRTSMLSVTVAFLIENTYRILILFWIMRTVSRMVHLQPARRGETIRKSSVHDRCELSRKIYNWINVHKYICEPNELLSSFRFISDSSGSLLEQLRTHYRWGCFPKLCSFEFSVDISQAILRSIFSGPCVILD